MKKLLATLALAPLAVTACGGGGSSSTPVIKIAIDNEEMGKKIVEAWGNYANKGNIKLEFVKTDLDQLPKKVGEQQGAQSDIILAIADQMVGQQHHFRNVTLDASVTDQLDQTAFNSVNINNAKAYFPVFANTMVFAYNKTLLAQAGVDVTTDADGDKRPDAFDTWEEIMGIADKMWDSTAGAFTKQADGTTALPSGFPTLKEIYPVDPGNAWAAYQLLSSKGFDMFPDANAPQNLGDQTKLKDGLQLIKDLGASKIVGAAKAPDAIGWRFDGSYENKESLFTSFGTWVGAKDIYTNDTGFMKMPGESKAINGTKGWAVNGYSRNASSAEKVLKWLLTKEVMQISVDNSSYLPSLKNDSVAMMPQLSAYSQKIVSAVNASSKSEPLFALPQNNKTTTISGYYGMAPENVMKDMWIQGSGQGTQTNDPALADATAAAAKLKELYDAWYATNNR